MLQTTNTSAIPFSPVPSPAVADGAFEAASAVGVAAAIATTEGEYIASGLIEITGDGVDWRARLSRLDQPGAVVAAYFSKGIRDVILRLEDGREGRARIAGTSFIAGCERICDLTALEPLA